MYLKDRIRDSMGTFYSENNSPPPAGRSDFGLPLRLRRRLQSLNPGSHKFSLAKVPFSSLFQWPLLRFRVNGHSMEPNFHEGDLLLVNRWVRPKVGDIVVARDPINIHRLILKRIKEEQKNKYVVAGDNKGHSIPRKITKAAILGKVIT